MASPRDYYEILGVPRTANADAIKGAFRTLALRYHPDRNKSADAEERFREIAEAYSVLSDGKRRAEYDAGGRARMGGLSQEEIFGGIDLEGLFGGLGFDLAGGPFGGAFGRRPAAPPRGANVEIALAITLDRVRKGGPETLRYVTPGTCAACRGRGKIIDTPCAACGGSGQARAEQAIKVTIPVGADDGLTLRVSGRGAPSSDPRGVPGDLYVVLHTAADPRFERRGADLWRRETIGVADAALGTRIEVPTLDGRAKLSVPAGTQPDQVFRISGKGLPEFGTGRTGDLMVRVVVRVPGRLSPEQRELFKKLQESLETRARS